MRALIPSRQRSKIITSLIEAEVAKRETRLYECAKAIEADEALSHEMAEWERATLIDGLQNDAAW